MLREYIKRSRNNIILLMIIIFSVSILNCSNADNKKKDNEHNTRLNVSELKQVDFSNCIMFIEANSTYLDGDSVGQGNIVLFDINKSQKHVIGTTNYDDCVTISPDKKKIAFTSYTTYEGDWHWKTKRDFFVGDLTTGECVKLNDKNEQLNAFGDFRGLKWSSYDNMIYFSTSFDNSIYKISEDGRLLEKVLNINNNYDIFNLSFNRDGTKIALLTLPDLDKLKQGNPKINILEVKTHNNENIFDNEGLIHIGGIFPNSSKILLKDSLLYIYDWKKKKSEYLHIPGEDKELSISGYIMLDDHTLLCIGDKRKLDINKNEYNRISCGIFLFDIKSKNIKWLVNSRFQIGNLQLL